MSDTTTSPLTPEQAAERAACTKYAEAPAEKVEATSDPRYFVLTSHLGSCGFTIAEGMASPEVGDVYRLYGTTGFGGGSFHGGDLRGEPCWYKTEAERDTAWAEALKANKQKKKDQWRAAEPLVRARIAALPKVLRERIERQARLAVMPDEDITWWEDHAAYEVFALTMATRIANWGPTEEFRALSHSEQSEAIEGFREGSGNTNGFAVALAPYIRMVWLAETNGSDHPVVDGWIACMYEHAAFSVLVGCHEMGCLPFEEGEYEAMRADLIKNGVPR